MSFEFQDFETLVEIPGEGQVRLVLSDDLDAAYAPLSPEMTARIADALDKAPGWLAVARERIREEFPDGEAPELTSVCVLSEPPEPWRFGVSFWVAEDREHGRGLQFAAVETGGYTVVEYGGAEVAFY